MFRRVIFIPNPLQIGRATPKRRDLYNNIILLEIIERTTSL